MSKQSVSNKDRRRLLQICVFTVDTVWKSVLRRTKTFDSDLAYVKSLLYKKERVVVSLDPSYRGLLDYEDSGQIVDALLKLGFSQVRETAEGLRLLHGNMCVL